MKKWMAIPMLAGAIVLGGAAMVANADKKSEVVLDKVEDRENLTTEKVEVVNHQEVPTVQYLSADEAIVIAMKTAQGTVTELELDDDDGRVHYEIEIEDGVYEYEFDIDAITGEVLDFEKDRDDD